MLLSGLQTDRDFCVFLGDTYEKNLQNLCHHLNIRPDIHFTTTPNDSESHDTLLHSVLSRETPV